MNIFKRTLLLTALLPAIAFSQTTVEDDFEGNGTITSWFGDDCQIDEGFSNPFQIGPNTSSSVLYYSDMGGSYANARFDVVSNFDLSQDRTFTLKIYVPAAGLSGNQPNQISLKLQDNTLAEPWTTQCEIIKPISLEQWQTVTFDFGADAFLNFDPASADPTTRTDFNRVLLQVNGENNNEPVLAYIDDFSYDGTISSPPPAAGDNYTLLVWADEFDTDGPADPSNWFHQTLLPNGVSWFNNEVQHYTDRTENTFVEDGYMHIVAKKETFTDQGQTKEYTSARLNSKFAFTYGKVEVRAKLPTGIGTWPAIWMLGKNIDENGGYWDSQFGTTPWPACGEIDIMEHWGTNQNYVSSALHTPSSFGGTVNHGGVFDSDVSTEFHTYSVVWTPEQMDFSLDGVVYYTYNPDPKNMDTWPFIAEQYILLNIAIEPGIDANFTESPMVIDYVRVYQEDTTTTTGVAEASLDPVKVYPNPVTDNATIEVPSAYLGASLLIHSSLGQLVQRTSIQQQRMTVSLQDLPAGLYIVSVQGLENAQPVRLIKQ